MNPINWNLNGTYSNRRILNVRKFNSKKNKLNDYELQRLNQYKDKYVFVRYHQAVRQYENVEKSRDSLVREYHNIIHSIFRNKTIIDLNKSWGRLQEKLVAQKKLIDYFALCMEHPGQFFLKYREPKQSVNSFIDNSFSKLQTLSDNTSTLAGFVKLINDDITACKQVFRHYLPKDTILNDSACLN